ncbi:MAG: response regulator [candidate division Zixibacteria bacterium]|nr:response regulator [candidate division Zixibacteria bacterium]
MSIIKDLRPIDVLLVEDNPGDVRLTEEALKIGKVANNLVVAQDGLEALDILHQRGKFKDAMVPDMILLDLNLPKVDGREVLRDIKKDEDLKRIPVIVLTTSQNEQDILKAYGLHANCYITKPVDLDDFINAVRMIENFWLSIVRLPNKAAERE